jgi:hypothetical protein
MGGRQLMAHLVGDYVLQSHWMAVEKTRAHGPAAAHALTYALPFLVLTRSPARLAVIAGSHFVLDRWRLARHVVWAKNQVAPAAYRPPHTATGYGDDVPPWLATWLLIVADNALHGLCNAAALRGVSA